MIVSASLRSMSRNRTMANYLADCYRKQAISPSLVNLRAVSLPFCDGETAWSHPDVPTPAKMFLVARVIMVATPIYNFDVSAALKNLIELNRPILGKQNRRFSLLRRGSLSYMSIMSVASSLMLDFRCLIIPRFVFATVQDFKAEELVSAEVVERIQGLAAASIRIRND